MICLSANSVLSALPPRKEGNVLRKLSYRRSVNHTRLWLGIVSLIFIALSVRPVWGHEISVLGGMIWNTNGFDMTQAVQFEYRDSFLKNFAWSVSYLNEGHFSDHHRDGAALQLWARIKPLNGRFFLEGGAGPYFYFDTMDRSGTLHYSNRHGWGGIVSGALGYFLTEHLFIQARANYIAAYGDIDTLSLFAGAGIDFESRNFEGLQKESSERNALAVLIGIMDANNTDPKKAMAWEIEYRRRFGNHVEATASYLDEGDNDLFHRDGIALQLWAVNHFFAERLTLGVGLGPYLARNRYTDLLTGKEGTVLTCILSATADYRFMPGWSVRLIWHRVLTDYDRDTDVLIIGPSFHF